MAMAQDLLKKVFLLLAIGAIFVTFSELWFYRLGDDTNYFALTFIYGLIGYVALILLAVFHVRTFWGLFLAASVFGFMVEGIPVPVLYEAPPFSIVWTSLAWHALLSVAVGWYFFRKIMIEGSWLKAIALNVAIGISIGVWNAYSWSVLDGPEDAEIPVYDWVDTDIFVDHMIVSCLVFMAGHFAFDRLQPFSFQPSKWEIRGFAALTIVTYVSGSLIIAFPFSLLLPVLMALCLWGLYAGKNKGSGDKILNAMLSQRISLWRYPVMVLIPLCAIVTYDFFRAEQIELETNAWVALTTCTLATGLFVMALVKSFLTKPE